MGNPRFVINPSCECGFFDKGVLRCISLHRAEIADAETGSVVSPAKSFHKCYSGGAGVFGEQLAEDMQSDLVAAGWDAQIVPPAGWDVEKPEMTVPKRPAQVPVPRYAPSKTHNAQIAILEVKNADLCDYYFEERNYRGRIDEGGAGYVAPEGASWPEPWGKPGHSPEKPVPSGRPKPALGPERHDAGIYIPSHGRAPSSGPQASGDARSRKTTVSLLVIAALPDRSAGWLTLEGVTDGQDGPTAFAVEAERMEGQTSWALASVLARGLIDFGLSARAVGPAVLFRQRDGRLPPYIQVRSEIGSGRSGIYVILGSLLEANVGLLLDGVTGAPPQDESGPYSIGAHPVQSRPPEAVSACHSRAGCHSLADYARRVGSTARAMRETWEPVSSNVRPAGPVTLSARWRAPDAPQVL